MRPVLVPPWQPQIDAVVDGRTRCTSVLEDVWTANPDNAGRTRIVGRVDGLCPPVVIARDDVDDALAGSVVAELVAWTPPAGSIYGPFIGYDDAYVAPFFAMLATLRPGT